MMKKMITCTTMRRLTLLLQISSHSITPGSQLADHGLSTLDDVLHVDDDARLRNLIVHDKKEQEECQDVVELEAEPKSKSVTNNDEYAVANMNDHKTDDGVPDSTSRSTQAPGTDSLFYTKFT
jgi:hypothetical protein